MVFVWCLCCKNDRTSRNFGFTFIFLLFFFYCAQGGETPVAHANVGKAWSEGIFGLGVKLLIIDDALNSDHSDVKANLEKSLTYDYTDNNDDVRDESYKFQNQ